LILRDAEANEKASDGDLMEIISPASLNLFRAVLLEERIDRGVG
jgi:hypothetical protein